MTEKAYLNLPEEIRIREFSVAGVVYVTTLLSVKTYHKKELTQLYKERWIIKLDFRSIKTHMGMEMLRCKSAERAKKIRYRVSEALFGRDAIKSISR